MKVTVSNFGLLHNGKAMSELVSLEPLEVIARESGPCNCGHDALGENDPRGEHASYCATQYVVVLVAGRLQRLFNKDIQFVEEEVTA